MRKAQMGNSIRVKEREYQPVVKFKRQVHVLV